jgi:hypothetical protein
MFHHHGSHLHAEVIMKHPKNRLSGGILPMALGLLMLVLTVPLPVQAVQMYEYTYTGVPFDYTNYGSKDFPGPASNYRITLRFVYGELPVTSTSLTGVRFTISDGARRFTGTAGTLASGQAIVVAAGADGLPATWLAGVGAGPLDAHPPTAPGWYLTTIFPPEEDFFPVSGFSELEAYTNRGQLLPVSIGYAFGPGVWSRVQVPISQLPSMPPSVLLLLLGDPAE